MGSSFNDNFRHWGLRAALLALGIGALAPVVPAAAAMTSSSDRVVIRGMSPDCMDTVAADVAALGGRMTRTFAILGGGSAVLPAGAAATLEAMPCVAEVTPDGTLTPASIGSYDPTASTGSLYNTTQLIGAQAAWAKGYTGQGVGVALIDTGVAPVQGLTGAGKLYNGPDLSFDSQVSQLTYNDEYGHGTHMAGIIAGNDLYGTGSSASYAGNTNAFIGVAPDA
ncbi:MAG TPA: S8 family serine peptidase, partial [Candidatus Dormibacteraeota bacterium]|nr:S8 family serine peptidase [Candidatus Dormibacteraeota bacterium]